MVSQERRQNTRGGIDDNAVIGSMHFIVCVYIQPPCMNKPILPCPIMEIECK